MQRVAIGAIMKQEAPYILEWVYYHKALGFELIIADNGGDDDTSKILYGLHQSKIIQRIDFRSIKTTPQIPAYRAILRHAKKQKIDIIGFLDCDEFFTRHIPIQSLSPEDGANYIESEFEKKRATQLSFHWLCYGGKTDYDDISLPVIERFSTHSNYEERRNVWVKSFVKVNEMFNIESILFLGPKVLNVHYLQVANKNWYLENEKLIDLNYDKIISHKTGAILHYQTKTREEFSRKIARGNADRRINNNNKEYFEKINFNDVQSKVDDSIISQVKIGINQLEKITEINANALPRIKLLKKLSIYLMSFGLSDTGGSKIKTNLYRSYKKWLKPFFFKFKK